MRAVTFATLLAVAAQPVFSQSVECDTFGATQCPYTAATDAQLGALIDEFCGNNGTYPWFEYYEDRELTVPGGYCQVTSDSPGKFDQAECNSGLNYIIAECNAQGFWIEGITEIGDVTFSVTNCALA